MAEQIYVNDGGVWRNISEVHVKDGGVWRKVSEELVRVGGVWERVYRSVFGTITEWGTTTFSANLNQYYFSTVKTVTVTGAGTCTASISGTAGRVQEFKVNSGSYSSADKTVVDGDQITLRQQASSSYSSPTTATITLTGGDTGSWTIYTQDP